MEKTFTISFETFLQIILAVLGIRAEYEGYFDRFKCIRLNFSSTKKKIENFEFSRLMQLRDWGIDGALDLDDNDLSGHLDVKFKTAINFESEMVFEIPQDILLQIVKKVVFETLNIDDEKDVMITPEHGNSIIIDVNTENRDPQVSLFNQDIRTIAMINCMLSIENVNNKVIRFIMTF